VGQAVVDIQVWAWGRKLETFVAERAEDLLNGLAGFLKIPEISRRAWQERIEQLRVGIEA
jgi:hypothetical protein